MLNNRWFSVPKYTLEKQQEPHESDLLYFVMVGILDFRGSCGFRGSYGAVMVIACFMDWTMSAIP